MRILFALAIIVCVAGTLWAKPTTTHQAEKAVKGWLRANASPLGAALGQKLKKTETFRDEQGKVIYYVVNLAPAGFVIVPADDLVEPILGFAEKGTYDPSLYNPLGALVNQDVKKRISAGREVLKTQGDKAGPIQKIKSKWEHLCADIQPVGGPNGPGLLNISDHRVDPLVRTKWNQTTCCDSPAISCYNYYIPPSDPCDPCDYAVTSSPDSPFPYGSPGNFPCGCVATAMAQLMRFHEHPTDGIGKVLCQIKVQAMPEQAWTRGSDGQGGAYDWDLMVYEPNCNTTDPNVWQAIGALCYDAGAAAKMDYNPPPNGSGAFLSDAKIAFKNIFKYSNAFYHDYNPVNVPGAPVSAMIKMINPNLDYNHPVIIAIWPIRSVSHAVVVDGYGYESETMYHHINMGWGGVQDAWYNFYGDMPAGTTSVSCCVYNIFKTGMGEIISGRVRDAYGSVLAGATVTAVRTGGGTYSATTNSRGIYALAHVPSSSTYTISVTEADYSFISRVVSTNTSADNANIGNVWDVNFIPFGINAVFVDANATGGNDGSNWPDAYKYLQDAIREASSGKIILVAEGTYKPDANSANPGGNGDSNETFQLRSGVAIYGGFPSGGCNSWASRDPNIHHSILSGDIGVPDNNSDNAYNVVTGGVTADNTAVLDGFVITAGNGGGGGGLYNLEGCPTINNCTFTDNTGSDNGGAVLNATNYSSLTMNNCAFANNKAGKNGGGAISSSGGQIGDTLTLTNCVFTGNSTSSTGSGGAIRIGCGTIKVKGCMFAENSSNQYGGAICVEDYTTAEIVNCTFLRNSARGRGGAIYNELTDIYFTIVNCLFFGNSVSLQDGGAVRNESEIGGRFTNCVFSGNAAARNGGAVWNAASNTKFSDCTFAGNDANLGGGMYNYVSPDPCIADCIFWGNKDRTGINQTSQIYNRSGSPTVKYSCIQDSNPNDANIPYGGAANHNIDDNPLFEREPDDGGNGWGDDNDDYGNLRLSSGSPCIDKGDNNSVPADTVDLDADGNTTEQTSLDVEGHPRFADGDSNDTVIVDMGAYEFSWIFAGDFDGDCDMDIVDFAILANSWLQSNPLVDIAPPPDGDGIVDFRDLIILCDNWLAGK